MSAAIAGRAFIKVDGQQIELKSPPKFKEEQISREPIMGINGVIGWTEKFVPAEVEFETVYKKDLNIKAIQNRTDLAITLELLDGTKYSITGASLVGEVEVDTEELAVSLKFVGTKGTKL